MKTMTTKLRTTSTITIAALFGLSLMANEATADIVFARQNITPQLGAAAANLDLDGNVAGVQALLPFTISATGIVRVIFNAEGTIGGATTAWLDDTIFIDGVACTPSNSDNALVSGNGTASRDDGWVSGVTQCFRTLGPGVHNVRVSVTPVNPANAPWRIDDLSLVIDTE